MSFETFASLLQASRDWPEVVACPACREPMRLRYSKLTNGIFYGCSSYPECKGTVKADQSTGRPLGWVPEDPTLKRWRQRAQNHIDLQWRGTDATITREQVYARVGVMLGIHRADVIVSRLTAEQCQFITEHLEVSGQRALLREAPPRTPAPNRALDLSDTSPTRANDVEPDRLLDL